MTTDDSAREAGRGPRPWSEYALMVAGLAVLWGASQWLKENCEPPDAVWAAGIPAVVRFFSANPLRALGYVAEGLRMTTAPAVLFICQELRATRPLRQYLALSLTLLGVALLTGVTGSLLAADVVAHQIVYHVAMGLLLGTALPGAAGLVHVTFARLRDRKSGR
ncbi:hypothetical protein F5972_18320 [Microbispora cellulosiformans]|uniref:Uncharacterized protein n=1 Tax=Microbispora cellulosiformans TaxID=2614688 RepID=A0A5J5K0A8_9ACTN|nr:hypothetical protein [Microbispora cellulosiformans]KAA9377582.1 hypothetical protein F5972_18320 [Microbispora cellulosiformans]